MYAERFENFKAMSARGHSNFALLLVDLDKFKFINDTYGHDVGDAVLVETARRLIDSTRAVDVVARLGGDEFAILLDGSEPLMSVQTVCQRLIDLNSQPILFKQHQLRVSMSVGAAIYGIDGTDQTELYKSADLALYESKRQGRNTWRCFSDGAMQSIAV
jgi:diguanylate cyclase (GGDEF)-like protein